MEDRSSNLMKYLGGVVAALFVLGIVFHKSIWVEYRLTQEKELNRLNEAVQVDAILKVKRMLKKGADPNEKDGFGRRPIYLAQSKEMAFLLLDYGADGNLDTAVYFDSVACAEACVELYADEYARSIHGGTHQFWEILYRFVSSKEMVEALTPLGIDADLALEEHMQNGSEFEVIEALVSAGADLSSPNSNRPHLHYAFTHRQVEFLLKNGADVDAREHYTQPGATALHSAPNAEVARALVAGGADVNAVDRLGQTPLHSVWSPEVAQFLIDRGVDPSAKDKEGRSPLHVTESLLVARCLVSNGADPEALDNQGQTPIQVNTENQITEYLRSIGVTPRPRKNQ